MYNSLFIDCGSPVVSGFNQTGSSSSNPSEWLGWFIYSSSFTPQIANGFYKILTNDDEDAFFYYDNRDCKYGGTGSSSYNPDAHFRYSAQTKIFEYRKSSQYHQANGQIITSWDILNEGTAPTTNCFEDFWDYSLIVLRSAENHPHLVWSAYPAADPETIMGYKIYFSEHQYGQPPGNFSLLTSVDGNTFNFEDVYRSFDSGGLNEITYIVKCLLSGEHDVQYESEASNSLTVRIGANSKINLNNKHLTSSEYFIDQNYPNPFNPVTTFNYNLKEDGLVNLKVYNILGSEVAILVNEYKSQGEHSVTFNADKLASGTYIYVLRVNDYTAVRKMVLLK